MSNNLEKLLGIDQENYRKNGEGFQLKLLFLWLFLVFCGWKDHPMDAEISDKRRQHQMRSTESTAHFYLSEFLP